MGANKPKLLLRLVSQLKGQGHDEEAALAIATSALEKSGSLDNQGNATKKGVIRGNMTPSQRAIDRASKASGRPTSYYVYNPKTNRATLRKR